MFRSRKKSPTRVPRLPGFLMSRIAESGPLNAISQGQMRQLNKEAQTYIKNPKAFKLAKAALTRKKKLNVVGRTRPINFKTSRVTRIGLVPAHLPYRAGGIHTAGHNTIKNWLAQYHNNGAKAKRLATVQRQMEKNNLELGNKIKNRFKKLKLTNN